MTSVSYTHLTLLGSDFVKEYHPLREYLDGLPPWDGETDYIGRLAAMVHVKELSLIHI